MLARRAAPLVALWLLGGCAVRRHLRMERSKVGALAGGRATVLADGRPREVDVSDVRPLGLRGDLTPAHYRFRGLLRTRVPYGEIVERWRAQADWREAEVRFLVEEPAHGVTIALGGLGGAALGGVVGALVARCDPSSSTSCEDSSAVEVLGVLTGAAVGGVLGFLGGWIAAEGLAPEYQWAP